MTPEEAWETFRLSLPTPIAPATTCEGCGGRVMERDYRYHQEELLQMKEAFLDLLRKAQGQV